MSAVNKFSSACAILEVRHSVEPYYGVPIFRRAIKMQSSNAFKTLSPDKMFESQFCSENLSLKEKCELLTLGDFLIVLCRVDGAVFLLKQLKKANIQNRR